MPAFFSTIKKFITKFLSDEKINKMIYNLATPETPEFHYLLIFKSEYHADIASILKKSPTVHNVVSFVLQNDKDILTPIWLKPTRMDEIQAIDLEAPTTDWEVGAEWFEVKNLLFFLWKNFKEYKLM